MKITAHIPTQPYGYIELSELPDDPRMIEQLYNRYAEKPIALAGERVKFEAFVGGSIYFDPITHTYTNDAGEVYLSGSEYASRFEAPFDSAGISAAMAKKYGVPAEDILAMWEMKAEISRGLGTALHAAMEYYGRFNGVAQKMGKTATHDNPMVMSAVKQFYATHPEPARYEVLIVDHATHRAGRIDRLTPTEDPISYYIDDFKTDVNIQKKLPTYQKQLSFYAAILEAGRLSVAGLRVHHWDGVKWTTYELTKEEVK